MLDLTTTDDREDVRRLLHHVRDRDRLDALRADLLRDLLEGLTDLAFMLVPLPDRCVRRATLVRNRSAIRHMLGVELKLLRLSTNPSRLSADGAPPPHLCESCHPPARSKVREPSLCTHVSQQTASACVDGL